jgi:hypothetical protein
VIELVKYMLSEVESLHRADHAVLGAGGSVGAFAGQPDVVIAVKPEIVTFQDEAMEWLPVVTLNGIPMLIPVEELAELEAPTYPLIARQGFAFAELDPVTVPVFAAHLLPRAEDPAQPENEL